MKRFRVAMLVTSVVVMVFFAGLLTAGLTSKESLFQALGNLAEVVHLVEGEYVDELDPDVLALSLDAGILQSVDPWAAVATGDEVEAYSTMLAEPPPYGLGLSLRLGSAAVRFVYPESPADDAGLKSWEVIEKIDGVYTRGQPLWQIALGLTEKHSRGETINLTVMDRQVDERREIALAPVAWQSVSARLEDLDDVQVLKIDSLTAGSAQEIESMMTGDVPIVLDLRGLVWGLEAEAISVADLFVDEGVIAAWEGRQMEGEKVQATEGATATIPIPTVLVDRETEGVGEILAAALQRAGAVLVGQETMGHAPHMQLVRRAGLNLWIPVGRWLDPVEEPIHGDGLTPDEEVEDAEADEDGDPILEHALGMIRVSLAEAA